MTVEMTLHQRAPSAATIRWQCEGIHVFPTVHRVSARVHNDEQDCCESSSFGDAAEAFPLSIVYDTSA